MILLFSLWVGFCVTSVIWILFRHLSFTKASLWTGLLLVWLIYTGYLGASGLLSQETGFPPRLVLIIGPMLAWFGFLTFSHSAKKFAQSLFIPGVMAFQCFRVLVEIFIFRLFEMGLMPKLMTFEGRNFDILVALSAPIAAWLVFKKKTDSNRIILGWNIAGSLILMNTVIHGILSLPGPQRVFVNDTPNVAVCIFPFVYIVSVFVLLAFSLHILAIRGRSS